MDRDLLWWIMAIGEMSPEFLRLIKAKEKTEELVEVSANLSFANLGPVHARRTTVILMQNACAGSHQDPVTCAGSKGHHLR